MTKKPEAPATNEELLRKVIEAQVKGGYTEYEPALAFGLFFSEEQQKIVCHVDFESVGITPMHVLEILLDTQGAKAAYPGYCGSVGGLPGEGNISTSDMYPCWKRYTEKIFWAWHSGPGNNVRSALETAVSFLPTP